MSKFSKKNMIAHVKQTQGSLEVSRILAKGWAHLADGMTVDEIEMIYPGVVIHPLWLEGAVLPLMPKVEPEPKVKKMKPPKAPKVPKVKKHTPKEKSVKPIVKNVRDGLTEKERRELCEHFVGLSWNRNNNSYEFKKGRKYIKGSVNFKCIFDFYKENLLRDYKEKIKKLETISAILEMNLNRGQDIATATHNAVEEYEKRS